MAVGGSDRYLVLPPFVFSPGFYEVRVYVTDAREDIQVDKK